MNYLHSFRTENKLISHEKLWKNKDICGIVISYEKEDILKSNFIQYMKPDKMPYINLWGHWIFSKKIYGCANDPENPSATKIDEHIPWGYSMPTIFAFII